MTRAEWLSSRDGVFFLLDGPTTPYHMAALAIMEGPPPGLGELEEAIDRRVGRVPRFRQRLVRPLLLNRAAWVEDPRFEVGDHVRHMSVRAPGSERELLEAVSVVMEQHLDHNRPLWELWVLDELAGGNWALVLKAHHALIDGVTGVHDLALLFDSSPKARPKQGPSWDPEPVPNAVQLLADGLTHRLTAPALLLRAGWRAAMHPARAVGTAAGVTMGLAEVAITGLRPVSRSPINGPIGPNRRVELVRVPLQDLKDVKNALGGTINDVVLAVTAGGLRRLIRSRGGEVDGLRLRALIPVSLRPGTDSDAAGNRVAGVVAPLPVDEPNPVRRLECVTTAMRNAKRSHEILATSVALGLPALLPPRVGRAVARVQRVQRFFNLSLTNVPGPAEPLYLCGRPILDLVALPPLSANCGLIIAVMSYAGSVTFGLVADPGVVPDLDLMAEDIEKSILELLQAAEVAS